MPPVVHTPVLYCPFIVDQECAVGVVLNGIVCIVSYIYCKQCNYTKQILHLLQSFPDVKRFPELHSIWVENISKLMQVKFVPMKNSRLCSKHFSADMFEKGTKYKSSY